MITLNNITLRRGTRTLLEKINWTIYHKQRIGLIGANGSGKSSLFAFILQRYQAEAGEIDIPRQLKFASVEQEISLDQKSAIDFVLDGDPELRELEALLRLAEENDDGEKIAILHEKLSIIDAYTAP